MYWRSIAFAMKEAGFFVSVVNAMLIHNFSDNSLRKVKTNKADALKIANYALTFCADLHEYSLKDENRQLLKAQSRLYERTQYAGIALKNGLVSRLNQTFPGANMFFYHQPRETNGHFKWVDFVRRFWHKDCVAKTSLQTFSDTYRKWCAKEGYRFSVADAERIHRYAKSAVTTFPKNTSTKTLITQVADSLNTVYGELFSDRQCERWNKKQRKYRVA